MKQLHRSVEIVRALAKYFCDSTSLNKLFRYTQFQRDLAKLRSENDALKAENQQVSARWHAVFMVHAFAIGLSCAYLGRPALLFQA
jgi:hypothetical protein